MYGYGYYGSRANSTQTFSLGRLLDSDTMEDNAPSRRELIMHAAVDILLPQLYWPHRPE